MQRRDFLSALAATSGAMALSGCATTGTASPRPFFTALGKPIGLQLYTLGDDVAKDIDGTMAQVAAIGYRTIELPQLYGKTPAVMRAAADKAGLKLTSMHVPGVAIMAGGGLSFESDTQKIVDTLGVLGIASMVMPIAPFPGRPVPRPGESFQQAIGRTFSEAGVDHWKRTAAILNKAAAAMKPHGITVGYHNHNMEFMPIDGTTPYDVLMKETDPALVKFEVDTGWVAAAGLDPVEFMTRYAGRLRWMHVKDLKATTQIGYGLAMDPTEVGSGEIAWDKVLPAAHRAGVEHFYVEQEPPFAMPRIESAAKSFAFLSALAV